MKKYNRSNLFLLTILAMALFAAACGGDAKKIEEANKFVASANQKKSEAESLFGKTANTLDFLKDTTDYQESKKAHENEVKESIKTLDKMIELSKSSAGDFTEAAKLNSNAKFKEYYEANSKLSEKAAEMGDQYKAILQAFIESEDIDAFSTKTAEIKSKSDSTKKEVKDLAEKVKKLEEEVKALSK